MSASRWTVVIGSCLVIALTRAAVAESVVYDNTTTYTGVEYAGLPGPVGNEITLAGTDRVVTSLEVALRLDGDGPATFKVRIKFYKNDFSIAGMDRPGTSLWGSGDVPEMIDTGEPVLFQFDVPNILVPDRFTWTIQVFDQQGNMGLLIIQR